MSWPLPDTMEELEQVVAAMKQEIEDGCTAIPLDVCRQAIYQALNKIRDLKWAEEDLLKHRN